MRKLLIFAGTTEGRELSRAAAALGYAVTASVATEYGRVQLDEHPNLTVTTGRMDADAMASFLKQGDFVSVIDATHPYAVAVSENIRCACEATGIRYLRLLREESDPEGCTYFERLADACKAADLQAGNILAATGSKQLLPYCNIRDYKRRVFVRVLPTEESVSLCRNAGFSQDHIIAAKGPFSKEENLAVMKALHIQTLITKDGGAQGGFEQKIAAAQECGAAVFVIKRPRENGLSYQQVRSILKEGI